MFNPSTDALDWLAVAVLIALFLRSTQRRSDHATPDPDPRRGLGALALAGSLVNSGASVFVVYAAATAGRLYPARRAVQVVAALGGLVGLIFVSPVPMPWRLAALGPALLFTPVVGAASIFDAERGRANQRLLRADEEIERLATIAERGGSPVTCTTCSGTPCRSSC